MCSTCLASIGARPQDTNSILQHLGSTMCCWDNSQAVDSICTQFQQCMSSSGTLEQLILVANEQLYDAEVTSNHYKAELLRFQQQSADIDPQSWPHINMVHSSAAAHKTAFQTVRRLNTIRKSKQILSNSTDLSLALAKVLIRHH